MKRQPKPPSGNFCGCCARPCTGEWCADCIPHLGPRHLPPWDRIYIARHNGEDCPFHKYKSVDHG